MKRNRQNNPVAKYGKRFNKAVVFKDRKKALKRGDQKHKHNATQNDLIAA